MKPSRIILTLLTLALLVGLIWQVVMRLDELTVDKQKRDKSSRPAPVVTAPIELTAIDMERAFSGTLEAKAEFVAAPKVGGVVERLWGDLGDAVERGQVVANLDNAEFVQAVNQAEAELAVAKANLAEANSLLEIAERELERIDQLRTRGVSSASQRDAAQADQLAKKAHVQVTLAQLARARSELETARIRLGYSDVIGRTWSK